MSKTNIEDQIDNMEGYISDTQSWVDNSTKVERSKHKKSSNKPTSGIENLNERSDVESVGSVNSRQESVECLEVEAETVVLEILV